MARTARWATTLGGIALALTGTACLLAGCGGGDGNRDRPKPPKAQTYIDEVTGEVFGVPFGMSAKDQVWPPIVNPKTGKRTLVQALYYESKETGKPVLYKMLRYTDRQIKVFNKAQAALADDSPLESVEVILQTENPAFEMEIKYAGEETWRKAYGRRQQTKSAKEERDEKMAKFKHVYTPVFDEKWPILKPEEIKQW